LKYSWHMVATPSCTELIITINSFLHSSDAVNVSPYRKWWETAIKASLGHLNVKNIQVKITSVGQVSRNIDGML